MSWADADPTSTILAHASDLIICQLLDDFGRRAENQRVIWNALALTDEGLGPDQAVHRAQGSSSYMLSDCGDITIIESAPSTSHCVPIFAYDGMIQYN
jgi:hypothetical protein